MLVIWYSIHGTLGMTLDEELFFSAFHSISAFCNAGFSILPGGMSNPLVMQNHNLLYITLGLLIALGGIGFPILVNLYETVSYYLGYWKWKVFGRSRRFDKRVHLYNLNTKIVLVCTAVLLVVGTLVIAVIEWNQALAGMPVADKLVHSFFNSSCPRTAGFVSVPLLSFFGADPAVHADTDGNRRRHAVNCRRCENQRVCRGYAESVGGYPRLGACYDTEARTFA